LQDDAKKSAGEATRLDSAKVAYDAAGFCVDIVAVLKDLKVVPGASLLPK
jgi:hypothetical protein